MNFLAHCFLSCTEEDLLLGNIITDFITRKDEELYSDEVKGGITLHRAIDSFTDSHPASLQLRKLLRPRHKKYAPVVVDLVWDYFLSTKWSDYSEKSLEVFNSEIYDILSRRITDLPPELKSRFQQMIADDFLMAYATESRMRKSLNWMDNRVKFNSAFYLMPIDIKENFDLISNLFDQFFPELIAHSAVYCGCN